jgi:hypothetical protein
MDMIKPVGECPTKTAQVTVDPLGEVPRLLMDGWEVNTRAH